MADKVYIGHGDNIGKAYGIEISLAPHLDMFGNLKEQIFHLARYNGDINRELNPESTFVVTEGMADRLRGHVCGNSRDEKYDWKKSQVLEAPDFTPLREYLDSAKGDRVVATNNSLVDRVEGIVKNMGYETIHFS